MSMNIHIKASENFIEVFFLLLLCHIGVKWSNRLVQRSYPHVFEIKSDWWCNWYCLWGIYSIPNIFSFMRWSFFAKFYCFMSSRLLFKLVAAAGRRIHVNKHKLNDNFFPKRKKAFNSRFFLLLTNSRVRAQKLLRWWDRITSEKNTYIRI